MDTLEEVKQILKEIVLDRERENKQREAERIQRETERAKREVERAQREAERAKHEAERLKREAEFEAKIKAERRARETQLEAERKEREANAEKSKKEWDKIIKNLSEQIGGLGNKFGSFTEGMAYNSMRKILLEKYGIENAAPRFSKKLPNGFYLEYDVFGYTNGTTNKAAIVEVKSHLRKDDVENFVTKLKEFKQHFPDHKNKQLYGIMATVDVISDEIKNAAWKQGIHLANIHEDVFTLIENPKPVDFNHTP